MQLLSPPHRRGGGSEIGTYHHEKREHTLVLRSATVGNRGKCSTPHHLLPRSTWEIFWWRQMMGFQMAQSWGWVCPGSCRVGVCLLNPAPGSLNVIFFRIGPRAAAGRSGSAGYGLRVALFICNFRAYYFSLFLITIKLCNTELNARRESKKGCGTIIMTLRSATGGVRRGFSNTIIHNLW